MEMATFDAMDMNMVDSGGLITRNACTNCGTGGYSKFVSQGLNEDYLPVWLQGQGYNTYYTGKLMNGHSTSDYDAPFAAGFNGSDCEFSLFRVSCVLVFGLVADWV